MNWILEKANRMNLSTIVSLLSQSKLLTSSSQSMGFMQDLAKRNDSCSASLGSFLQDTEITGICIDSRALKPGHFFVAIKGDTYDGHDFVLEAQKKGAVGALVTRFMEGATFLQVEVLDTLRALAKIAQHHRQTMSCPVIALTGSNGKTTVKEMIAAILPRPSQATKGNLNNHIGAPLCVLELHKQHRYAVFELGANHPGEIAQTVAVVAPDVTLINNIAPAHIEGFGSIDGVAIAKGEIHRGLKPGGVAVINDDDAYAHFWDELLIDKKILRFSSVHPAHVYAEDIHLEKGFAHFSLITPKGKEKIKLKVPGLHNVQNALAACACAYAVGISNQEIQCALNEFTGVKGRMTFLKGKNQSLIMDDTYNANLRSTLTALEVLASQPGKKIVVFGDMGELGQWAAQHHQEVGRVARQLGIHRFFTVGFHSELASTAFGEGSRHFASQANLVEYLLKELAPDTSVLVKGSRSSAMEKIVDKLLG